MKIELEYISLQIYYASITIFNLKIYYENISLYQ